MPLSIKMKSAHRNAALHCIHLEDSQSEVMDTLWLLMPTEKCGPANPVLKPGVLVSLSYANDVIHVAVQSKCLAEQLTNTCGTGPHMLE